MSGWHTRKKVTPPEGQGPGKPVTGEIPAGLPGALRPRPCDFATSRASSPSSVEGTGRSSGSSAIAGPGAPQVPQACRVDHRRDEHGLPVGACDPAGPRVSARHKRLRRWASCLPPARWLQEYRAAWLHHDIAAGVTLAAYAIPVSLAYAGLAGLPPQVGVYGYLLGGLGYALLGSSRQLAIGPTSAISLMIAGTVGAMADGDAQRYHQIASLTAFAVAALCLFAWAFRLSVLVKLISDSILVGFKAGAGLTIAMTQLPSLFGVAGGGHNFFERAWLFVGQLGQMQFLVVVIGAVAIVLLAIGHRMLPGKPVALAVVALAIIAASMLDLPALGVPITGEIPAGLPALAGPALRLRDVEGIVPLAGGCLLLAYIEGVSAARTLRSEARIRAGLAARVSRPRRSQSRGRARARLSGGGRPLAIGGERPGRRAHPACADRRVDHPRSVPAVPDRPPRKSTEGNIGRGRADCRVRLAGFSSAVAHVAGKPISTSTPQRSRSSVCCCWEYCTASCLPHSPPYCCCWRARHARTWHSSAAFPAPTAFPISPVIPKTSRCPACWHFDPKRR